MKIYVVYQVPLFIVFQHSFTLGLCVPTSFPISSPLYVANSLWSSVCFSLSFIYQICLSSISFLFPKTYSFPCLSTHCFWNKRKTHWNGEMISDFAPWKSRVFRGDVWAAVGGGKTESRQGQGLCSNFRLHTESYVQEKIAKHKHLNLDRTYNAVKGQSRPRLSIWWRESNHTE